MVESGAVRLVDLFREAEGSRIVGDPTTSISFLSYRNDTVGPGHLFFCVPGFVSDGHEFAEDAIARGAAALCVERELPVVVPQVVVPSVRWVMGPVASVLYEQPSARLAAVGITGTNGKTTSAYLTAFLLDEQGRRAGVLGTVERRIGGARFPAGRTTPEAVDLQQDLALMVDAGDQAAVLEVSSHALDLGRVCGITFAAVAFTNLTQDHLDYHGDLETYFAAKSMLFLDPRFARNRPVAVINADDPFGRILAERLTPDRLLTFRVGDGPSSTEDRARPEPDLEARDLDLHAGGTLASLVVRGRAADAVRRNQGLPLSKEAIVRPLETPLPGRFNMANVVTALGLGIGLGLELEPMLESVSAFHGVPGRMERVDAGQPFAVLVDYAHTPDAITNVLQAARGFASGRIIALFGCGGDRDPLKRPEMARAAEERADVIVVTSDNPRSEDPRAIIDAIMPGFTHPEMVRVQPDRRAAIAESVRLALPGDVVLILGKGHETGQESQGVTVPFDDRLVAREVLEELAVGER